MSPLFFLLLLPVHISSYIITEHVYLNPSNEKVNDAQILRLGNGLAVVDTGSNQYWDLYATNNQGFNLQLVLDKSIWAFHSTEVTTITILIDSTDCLPSCISKDIMIAIAQDGTNKFFVTVIQIDNSADHLIWPPCDTTAPFHTQYETGNIKNMIDAYNNNNDRIKKATNNNIYNNFFASGVSYPLQLTLENHPGSPGYMLFSYKPYGGTTSVCGYVAMQPDLSLDVYIAGEDAGENFIINSINVTKIYDQPTSEPTSDPTKAPTNPTTAPSNPTIAPTNPTKLPTKNPTDTPSNNPTKYPSKIPTKSPSNNPSNTPSNGPTKNPSNNPTITPSKTPSKTPTYTTNFPSNIPSKIPTIYPTISPSKFPSKIPSKSPTNFPTKTPSFTPTINPSNNPTKTPTAPTMPAPSKSPTENPSTSPTDNPIIAPTNNPSSSPSLNPSDSPTKSPSNNPSKIPTKQPTATPITSAPTDGPSKTPSLNPTVSPTNNPSISPTTPSIYPTDNPSLPPTETPSFNPSIYPTNNPSLQPTPPPTDSILVVPKVTESPTNNPSISPTTAKNINPSNIILPKTTSSETASNSQQNLLMDNLLDIVLIILLAVIIVLCVYCIYYMKHRTKSGKRKNDIAKFQHTIGTTGTGTTSNKLRSSNSIKTTKAKHLKAVKSYSFKKERAGNFHLQSDLDIDLESNPSAIEENVNEKQQQIQNTQIEMRGYHIPNNRDRNISNISSQQKRRGRKITFEVNDDAESDASLVDEGNDDNMLQHGDNGKKHKGTINGYDDDDENESESEQTHDGQEKITGGFETKGGEIFNPNRHRLTETDINYYEQ